MKTKKNGETPAEFRHETVLSFLPKRIPECGRNPSTLADPAKGVIHMKTKEKIECDNSESGDLTQTGTNPSMPFRGGWTEVIADSYVEACEIFSETHPRTPKGFLNCASAYEEKFFEKTKMAETGTGSESSCPILLPVAKKRK